jgi:hypothetical protein
MHSLRNALAHLAQSRLALVLSARLAHADGTPSPLHHVLGQNEFNNPMASLRAAVNSPPSYANAANDLIE